MTDWPLMTEAELHALGVDLLVPLLGNDRFDVESVDRDPSKLVQVTGRRWGLPAVIATRTACFPERGDVTLDEFYRLLAAARKIGGLPCFASVCLVCVAYPDGTEVTDDSDRGKPIRGGRFQIDYNGLLIAALARD